MAGCPRCRQMLEANRVDEFEVRICPPCRGALLKHLDLQDILDRSWRSVPREEAEKVEFKTSDALKTEPSFHCPDCNETMDKYGYMGMAAIPIDRCDKCALVWLDADELQNMVFALARSNYRSERARRREEETTLMLGTVGAATAQGAVPFTMWWGRVNSGMAAAQLLFRLMVP